MSDDPETFPDHGRLFHGPLPNDGSAARVLFDHVNGSGTPKRILVGIVNTGAVACSIDMLGGGGGPDANGMQAGHMATLRFLQARVAETTYTHALPAGGAYVLATAVLDSEQCFAGIYDIEPSSGAELQIRVLACDPEHTDMSVFDVLPEVPMTPLQRRGIFTIPAVAEESLSFTGARVTFPVGNIVHPRAPLDPNQHAAPHKGEYGILRRIACTIGSGTAGAMYQTPRAGAATGSYYYKGKMFASHAVPAKTRSKIAVFDANDTTATLLTMAEINSSYPLDITVEANDIADVGPGDPASFVYEA